MKKILSMILSLAMLIGLLGIVPAVAEETAQPTAEAFIGYANSDWTVQYWNDGAETKVKATNAQITGSGSYTVGLDFTEAAPDGVDLAFTALIVKGAIENFPGLCLNIKEIRVNGEAVDIKEGYTNDEDGATRMNIFNEWVTDLPADARSVKGNTTDLTAQMVDKAAFTAVKTMEVDFDVELISCYIAFANSDWTVQYFGGIPEAANMASAGSIINGEGTYQAKIEMEEPIADIAFAALIIKNGNKVYPGYFIDVKEVKINGEAVEVKKGYTSSDDGIEMRSNLFNEWVTELPKDARRKDGDLEGASAIIVEKDAFKDMKTIEVTFDFIFGEKPVEEAEVMTEEEAKAAKEAGFHAYIGVQGTDTYVFRNAWYDSYGLNDTENPFFNRLTGWDPDNNAVDYGGTFKDVEIKEDGTYTVSLTTGEMGFGETKAFNLLFVSTDIPNKLMKGDFLKISDIKVKIGGGATQESGTVNTEEGDYTRIDIINTYSQTEAPFGYTVPGPNETIEISFTVSGMAD